MEAVGVMADWKSSRRINGNEHVTLIGQKKKQPWCAERLTVVPPLMR